MMMSMLEWLFEGSITVDLLNQKEDKSHCLETFDFNRYTEKDSTIASCVCNEKEHGVGCEIQISSLTLT